MQEKKEEFDIDAELPPMPPTLRRQNAMIPGETTQPRFFDTKTHELVSGNPDLEHKTNKDLVKLLFWQSGRCKPNQLSDMRKNDRSDRDDASASSLVECKA
ncbi:hypothetical protein [Legionella waltersii]|uniref:Uncharacterized protein n=1 Tax=Legionella waltersii TaxID=66969 RepID=A0A0W1A0S4_9GAMM|nr:hypothetical protein [Legionella waltersii]KTD74939.1 hypothetical protein Lwal_2980 [Legionella waltersii]SNV08615.1 Uncharacterised protein [Legionella waltersii]